MNVTTFKILKYFAFTVAILGLIWFGYAWFIGDELTLPWQVESSFKTRPFLLEYFQLNGKPFGITVDQIISWQKFRTGTLIFLEWPQYLLLVSIMLVLVIGTISVTYLDRFSYFIFSGIIVFSFIQFRLEELGVAAPYFTYGLIGAYFLVSYYFQAFNQKASVLFRLITVVVLYIALALLVNLLPNMQEPNMVILSFGIIGPILWTSLFIVFIAGDNVYSLFKLTTQGATEGKNALIHFGVIGLIYVVLIALLFLEKEESISLDLYFIEPSTLLIASMISGYFCFDKKIETIKVSGDLIVLKQWLYPALCALTLGFFAYAKITANSSLENALEWVVLISHLAFGAAFFVYALINFLPALLEDYVAWPAFFKGPRTPMLTVRLFCVILVVGGFLYLEYRPYYLAKSGQYNMLARVADHIGNEFLGTQYHRQSNYFEYYNFTSNYALARRAATEKEKREIPERLIAIMRGDENPKARIAYSNYLASQEDLYGTLSSLLYSPEMEYNAQVKNNLGLAYYDYQNLDSAYKYLSQSLAGGDFVSEANLAALNYDIAARIDFDTTIYYRYESNIHLKLNRQALANAQRDYLPFELEIDPDTLLTREELFYLYNAALSQKRPDYETLKETIEYYLSNPKNQRFNTFLLTSLAFLHYNSGNVNQAFQTIDQVIASNLSAAGFPYYVKAIWAFDQGQAELTVNAVNNARKRGFDETYLKEFVAELKYVDEYSQKADISQELDSIQQMESDLAEEAYVAALVEIAQKNAFDVNTTLEAFEYLKDYNYSTTGLYDLLREALMVNQDSPDLLSQYILLCAQNGYRQFGITALEKLKPLVESEDYSSVEQQFYQLLEERRQMRP